MLAYKFGKIFSKYWFWFENPHDVPGASLVNFFSYEDVEVRGFKKKMAYTSLIDLTKTEEELWVSMRPGFIRDQISRGEKRGIKLYIDREFESFAKLDKAFRLARKLPKYNLSPLKKVGRLYTAMYENELLAGAIVVSDDTHARVLVLSSRHGVSKDLQNAIGQANRMIMWQMIKDAKNRGKLVFDLGGLDIDSEGNLTKLGEFKQAFGGERKKNFFYHKVYSPVLKIWIMLQTTFKKLS